MQHSKSALSVMFCGSASGTFLPPMVIYKTKHVKEEWMRGGTPGGAIYDCSPSGRLDSRTFTRWFKDVFLPNTSHLVGRRMILGDNVASHFEPGVIALCEEHIDPHQRDAPTPAAGRLCVQTLLITVILV